MVVNCREKKKKKESKKRRKNYRLDLVLLNMQFLLFYPLQLGLCVYERMCEGEGE